MKLGLAVLSLALTSTALAQTAPPPQPDQPQTLRATTTIVLVPALVTTKNGEPVFTLTPDDFILTDDGVPQTLRLEDDTDRQPIALVVVIEAGGEGATHLDGLEERLGPMIETLVGPVEHTVAVVGFDSEPALVQPFTSDMQVVDQAIRGIGPGNGKAAILDGLSFAVDQLRNQPPRYRRAIISFTETLDHGSHIKIADALRAVSDTNTAIYSFAFNSTRAEEKSEAGEFSSRDPGPEHGCMGRDPNADPTKEKSRGVQAYDCASLLAPPLRLAKMAAIAAANALRKNVPETVAHLTGGEYYSFSNEKNLERGLQTLTNHIPNRYVLSFHPVNPHPGLHAVTLQLKDRPNLKVAARTSYWAAGPAAEAITP
jgi:VWFA-related protein